MTTAGTPLRERRWIRTFLIITIVLGVIVVADAWLADRVEAICTLNDGIWVEHRGDSHCIEGVIP